MRSSLCALQSYWGSKHERQRCEESYKTVLEQRRKEIVSLAESCRPQVDFSQAQGKITPTGANFMSRDVYYKWATGYRNVERSKCLGAKKTELWPVCLCTF